MAGLVLGVLIVELVPDIEVVAREKGDLAKVGRKHSLF